MVLTMAGSGVQSQLREVAVLGGTVKWQMPNQRPTAVVGRAIREIPDQIVPYRSV
jgi:hypothetical protein